MLILTTIVYPIVCFALFAGFGFLAFRAAGAEVKPAALIPAGLTTLIVVGQALAWLGITSPWNLILIAGLAVAGWMSAVAERSRLLKIGLSAWLAPIAGGVIATGVVIAPVLLSGNATLAGFLLDTTAGVQMLGADHLVQSGSDFAVAGRGSSSESLLAQYFVDAAYPVGSHVVLGMTGAMIGTSLIWVYTPMMAVMAGTSAIGVYGIAERFGTGRKLSVLTGVLAAVPALGYSFLLQGSIKEVVFLPCLVAGSLLLLDPELRATKRQIAVLGGICFGAMFATIGLGAIAWAAPFGLGYTICFLVDRNDSGRLAWRSAAVASASIIAVMLLAIAPKFGNLASEIDATRSLSQSNAALAADPGNLFAPIEKKQAVGVWLGGSHRVPPSFPSTTVAILGLCAFLLLVAVFRLARDHRVLELAWLAGLAVVWLLLTHRGTMWLDAKVVMLNSFAVVVMIIVGAAGLRLASSNDLAISSPSMSALPAAIAISIFTVGVLASDAAQYRATGIMPSARYQELNEIGDSYAGKGPGFIPDFDEYALYVLRKIRVSGPGNADSGDVSRDKTDGSKTTYGQSVDPDHLRKRDFTKLQLAIVRRGPWRSSPGATFELARHGRFYDVWRRDVKAAEVKHLKIGNAAYAGVPKCRDVAKLKRIAERIPDAKLVAGDPGVKALVIPRTSIDFEGPWAMKARATGVLDGSGTMNFEANVLNGQWLWWQGNIDRPVSIYSDGRFVGRIGHQSGGMGNTIGPVKLPPGKHTIRIERGRGTLAPGDHSSTVLEQLALASPAPSRRIDVTSETVNSLCSRQLDWLAVVR